jgi:hypothetical protein
MKPVAEKLQPVFDAAHNVIVMMGPHLEKANDLYHEAYKKLEPYHPNEFLPVIIGFVLCFYGGAFCTTLAAVEAFRQCGYTRCKKASDTLYLQFKVAEEQMKKDELQGSPTTKAAAVAAMDTQERFKRKLKIALKTCDPEELRDGLNGLYTGLFAVFSTLQLRFAQVATLGASLGEALQRQAKRIEPALQETCSPEFKKWVPQVVSYACIVFGVSLAWMVQRVIFGFTSAVQGAQMLCRGGGAYLVRNGYVDAEHMVEGSATFNYVEMLLGAIGFYAQFSRGFGLGWMAMPLFPVSCVEFTLGMLVGRVA